MISVFRANLEIDAPRPLAGTERAAALRRRRYRTLREWCDRAGIALRVTGGPAPQIALWNGPGHARTVSDQLVPVYLLDRHLLPQDTRGQAFRALEVLAFGFNDYAARETMCGRGYFAAEITPEDGRAWLREIGRRGGAVRSSAKRRASRENGRHDRRFASA